MSKINPSNMKYVDQWRPWRYVDTEDGLDALSGGDGYFLTGYGPEYFPMPLPKHFHKPLETFSAGSYSNASKALTKNGAFSNYGFAKGDVCVITACTTSTYIGDYPVGAKNTDGNTIYLSTAIGADQASVTGYIIHTRRYIIVRDYPSITVRCFGINAQNLTASVRITGWMRPDVNRELVGKGRLIWDGVMTLGSDSCSKPPHPSLAGLGSTIYEVDIYTATDNPVGCVAVEVTNGQSFLVIPTAGCFCLLMEVKDLDGTGEMTKFGAIWHPYDLRGSL